MGQKKIKSNHLLLGAHVSVAGGYTNALTEAERLGADVIQIFTKNQRYWLEKFVTPSEGRTFRDAMAQHGVTQAFSHAIYLISLGSENTGIVEKSIASLIAEINRCDTLGLTHTVLHPGAAGSRNVPEAIAVIGDHIKTVLKATSGSKVKILLENTAGSGTSVGGKIENIAALMKHIGSPRIGLCVDTCHAFAAGYDIRNESATAAFFKGIDKLIGLDQLLCFHLNDSKGGCGSRLDRHAHIGEGQIGLEAFRYVMKNFKHVPKVLETPKEEDADVKNLALLRRLAG